MTNDVNDTDDDFDGNEETIDVVEDKEESASNRKIDHKKAMSLHDDIRERKRLKSELDF